MRSVAQAAGVSLKSVSRVINDDPSVSEQLRAKVRQAFEILNYEPDAAARSLAGTNRYSVTLLIPVQSSCTEWSEEDGQFYVLGIQNGAARACAARNYMLRLEFFDAGGDLDIARAHAASILRRIKTDCVILVAPLVDDAKTLDLLEELGQNYIRISPDLEQYRSNAVEIDDYAAGVAVAEYLIKAGHRNFACVGPHPDHNRGKVRIIGFKDRVKELLCDARMVEDDGNFTFLDGMKAGRRIFQAVATPVAVFAANDDSAVGVIEAAKQAGLRVPEDVSVVGFDNSMSSRLVWPPLTTVNQPIGEMAREAVSLALDNPDGDPKLVTLPFRLVERGSVQAVAVPETTES